MRTAQGMAQGKARLEDRRMITGSGRYAADWNLPGQAHAHFVRAERAHAEILSIDLAAARALPGVLLVLRGEDLAAAGFGSLPANLAFSGVGGMTLRRPPRPVLALGRVRHAGEPVALVVARTAALAQDAAERVAVSYRDLPAVTTGLEATASQAPQLHAQAPQNIVFEYAAGDAETSAAAFRAAARVVRLTTQISRVVANPMEPRACLALYEEQNEQYVLHACTQGAAGMAGQVATAMGLPAGKVTVLAREVGGGFGVRSAAYPEYCATLFAARLLRRPVKWSGTRSEVFLADNHGRDVLCGGEMALDAGGRMLGLRFSFLANLGAYLTPTGPMSNTAGVVNCISGVYDVPASCSRTRLAISNTTPAGAYRGAGRPIMSYALERLVDQAAHETGADPAQFRRRNFVRKDAFPYRLATGTVYDCGDFEGVLDKALAAADWEGFPARRESSAHRGRLRGRGIATSIEATAAGLTAFDAVQVRFDAGGRVALMHTGQNQGQGHETVFAQVISGVLGLPMDSIDVVTGQRGMTLEGGGSGGSRSLAVIGAGLYHAANKAVEQGRALAAAELEAAPADIEFENGSYRIAGTDRSVSLASLARKYALREPHPLNAYFEMKGKPTYPNGCHIAEVEVDPDTGHVQIVSYVACDDTGNIIHHPIVEGQVHGGLTQGAGQILSEQAVYERATGQLLSGSFMDYAMPRAVLVGGLRVLEHPVPTASNPLGAKGVGESGVTGSMPAVMNAVLDALRQAGVTHFDMPASPDRVWRALRAAKAGQPRAFAAADFRLD